MQFCEKIKVKEEKSMIRQCRIMLFPMIAVTLRHSPRDRRKVMSSGRETSYPPGQMKMRPVDLQ